MYKELKTELEDKIILEELISSKKERIKYIIQRELGIHATTYSELKIQCPVIDDKNARVFGKVEKLDKELQELKEELSIIEKNLENIDKILAELNDTEKKVFRCRYIWGMSVKQTADRLNYSEQHIKRITKEILKK